MLRVSLILAVALGSASAFVAQPSWLSKSSRVAVTARPTTAMSAESSEGEMVNSAALGRRSFSVLAASALALQSAPARAEGETFDVKFDIYNDDGSGGEVVIEVHPE